MTQSVTYALQNDQRLRRTSSVSAPSGRPDHRNSAGVRDKRPVAAMLLTGMLLMLANMSIEPIITVYVAQLVADPDRVTVVAGVVMSAATAVTLRPVAERISAAVASSSLAVRALITRSTPFLASDIAQAFPSPLLAAHTIAFLSLMPRSMVCWLRAVDWILAAELLAGSCRNGRRLPDSLSAFDQ